VLRHVLHDERIAQVRLVGAVFAQAFGERNTRPVLRHRLAVGKVLEHTGDDRLHRSKNILLRDEAHLEIELIELARQAVSARILVAEAWRDLEIAVKARHHQELLVLLRGLRQRIELAGMDARRHQEVARALRRGRRQDRRLEFEEAFLLHPCPHGINDLTAGHDVLVQLLATQIEEAIFQPDLFRVFQIAEHRQRQFGGFTQHLDVGDEHFDLAGRQVGIVGALRAMANLAVDLHHPLRTQLFRQLERLGIRIDDALRHAVMVAQIDEQQTAVIADAMAPARQADVGVDVALAERAAGMGPVAMHGNPEKGF